MKYKVENKKGQILIKFSIDAAEWNSAIESVYQKSKGKYSMPGFRKGKVPRKVLENAYGKGFFFEDAFNDMFPKYYYEVLDKETEIFPVDRPDVDVTSIDDKGVKFTALVTVKPEVELGEYKNLGIEKKVESVKTKEVEAELNKMADKNARLVSVTDRAVVSGDEVIIDYSGSINGELFAGGTAGKQSLKIGSGMFIPGFEEQVIGMNIGEEKDINVKFPEDYHAEDLKGKDAVFAVKLHEIKAKEMPVMDDEFAKDVSEFDTLKDLKADIKKRLTKEAKERAEIKFENDLIAKACENAKVEIPQCMIESQIDSYVQEFEYQLSYQGIKLDDYLKYTNSTIENLRDIYKDRAAVAVKTRLVMEAIVKAEEIKADKKSVNARIEEIAKQMGKEVDEVKSSMHPSELEYIENEVISKNVVEFLKKNNVVEKEAE
ncbi:MAG: trigger factor [Clostridiales bacterium]|nr:trigger factor [Clostridiales bacterium]